MSSPCSKAKMLLKRKGPATDPTVRAIHVSDPRCADPNTGHLSPQGRKVSVAEIVPRLGIVSKGFDYFFHRPQTLTANARV